MHIENLEKELNIACEAHLQVKTELETKQVLLAENEEQVAAAKKALAEVETIPTLTLEESFRMDDLRVFFSYLSSSFSLLIFFFYFWRRVLFDNL